MLFDSLENYLSLAWWSSQPTRNSWQVIEISNLVIEKGESSATEEKIFLFYIQPARKSSGSNIDRHDITHIIHQLRIEVKRKKEILYKKNGFKVKSHSALFWLPLVAPAIGFSQLLVYCDHRLRSQSPNFQLIHDGYTYCNILIK